MPPADGSHWGAPPPGKPEAPEPLLFGMERELEYTGHITQVMHFVPLPKRAFASADETHIRIWGQDGDIVKKTFPSNQRSMVTAMAFCPTFSALITTEVDMTLKLYTTEKLELIDTFSLQQARKSAKGGEKVRTSHKVSTLVYFPQHKWVIVGGDSGSDLYRIERSTTRRTRAVDVLEYHLKMDWLRQVTTEAVSRVVPHPAEGRVLVWGPTSLHVFDMDLSLIVSCHKPHTAPVCSACVHVVSSMETALLTGGADGHVNFWVVQSRAALADRRKVDVNAVEPAVPEEEGSSIRLQHSFHGHSRTVEIVNFYHRLQRDMRQRLCVSYARDCMMKVWSLEHFSLVYTLDQNFLDSRSSIFSLAPHFFAVSSTYVKQDGLGKSATVTLVRFTSHVATPFATTNHSPVVSIAQPPVEVVEAAKPSSQGVSTAAAIISEDMAVRLVNTANASLIATLPPPPNSKVQVLRSFICPVWQLLVLWLSSEEIAIFFIPSGKMKGSGSQRTTNSTTPLLLRRFGIVEVRAEVLDKDLSNEAFRSVALHHGWPLPAHDTLVSWTLDGKAPPVVDESKPSPEPEWFLVVGTKVGTLQVFLLRDILGDLPAWRRLASQLPDSGQSLPSETRSQEHPLHGSGQSDPRLRDIELEHLEAMEEMRAPGQRPFPRGAPPLLLHGRWRCHDYAVEVTESVGNRILTVDAKRNLKVWRAGDMSCLCHFGLNAFDCHVPYVVRKAEEGDEASTGPDRAVRSKALALAGLAVGTAGGGIQLIVLGGDIATPAEPRTFTAHTSHGATMVQLDYSWSSNVFVSIGRDDVVKIWSGSLALLRDIAFPAPLTSICFRLDAGVDSVGGNGDILVGFAAHVEQIPFETWSRGIPEEDLDAQPGQGGNEEEPSRTKRGLLRLDASDDINDHGIYLYSDNEAITNPQEALAARNVLRTKQGVAFRGAAAVANFARRLVDVIHTEKSEQPKSFVREGGEVMDFRGPPLPQLQIGALAGAVADWDVIDPSHPAKESKDPVVDHQRSETLDRGDFRALTRCYPHYYDWSVSPNTIVDAPREQALRGIANTENIAQVTSLGIGHLRSVGTDDEITGELDSLQVALSTAGAEEAISDAPPPAVLPGRTGPRRPFRAPKKPVKSPLERQLEAAAEQPPSPCRRPQAATVPAVAAAACPSRAPAAAPVAAAEQPSPPCRRLPAAPTPTVAPATCPAKAAAEQPPSPCRRPPAAPAPAVAAAEGGASSGERTARPQPPTLKRLSTDSGGGGAQQRGSMSLDSARPSQAWRNRRIGRGVPKSENEHKARSQSVANTIGDSACLLQERNNLQNAPELPEENFLKSLFDKKTDWLYYPSESDVLKQRRNEIRKTLEQRTESFATWTTSGRFVCNAQSPPVRALPASATASQALQLPCFQPRTCITRAEVTEQRLIEAALCGPPPPVPDLALHSRENWRRDHPTLASHRPSFRASVSRASSRNSHPRDCTPLPLSAR